MAGGNGPGGSSLGRKSISHNSIENEGNFDWRKVKEELEEIDRKIDKTFEGGSSRVENRKDDLTHAWILNIQDAYHEVNDMIAQVVNGEKDPQEAVRKASETIEQEVFYPFREHGLEDRIENYNNHAELYASRDFNSPEFPVNGDLGLDSMEEFHPHIGELSERYETLIELYENLEKQRGEYSWNDL